MAHLFEGAPEELRDSILQKAALYGETGQDKQTALWSAAQDALREAINDRREIADLIEANCLTCDTAKY